MTRHQNLPKISLEELRVEIKKEYTIVALDSNKSCRFRAGRRPGKRENTNQMIKEAI